MGSDELRRLAGSVMPAVPARFISATAREGCGRQRLVLNFLKDQGGLLPVAIDPEQACRLLVQVAEALRDLYDAGPPNAA